MKRFVFIFTCLALAAPVGLKAADSRQFARADADAESLKAKAKEIAEKAQQAIATAYDASRERLNRAGQTLRNTRDEAAQNLEPQLKKAQEQLDALAKRLEESARSAKDTTAAKAREAEQAVARRAKRIEARALLLRVKASTTLAVKAAAKNDFTTAEKLLVDATEYLRQARALLVDDHTYDGDLIATKAALNEATSAVKAHAENARKKIEEAISDTDKVVGSLEVEEKTQAVIRGS
jgi:hypothetical protein